VNGIPEKTTNKKAQAAISLGFKFGERIVGIK
jgi:hypothetical protein